jgi:hypothetical protein
MAFEFKAGIIRGFKRNNCGLKILLLTTVLGLQGCPATEEVASVGKPKLFPLSARPDPVCDSQDPQGPFNGACTSERLHSLAFAAIGKESIFNMQGSGTCGEVSFDFGDGRPPKIFHNISFAQG